MYGPPPDCKWFEVVRKNSPRKCIRPLSGELCLRALDDDPHVSVLINPSVTRDAFSPAGFRHVVGQFFRLLLSSADLGKQIAHASPSWRWESGKRFVLSKRSVFSTAIKRPPVAAAADVDSLGRWTARPRRCAPVCWQWLPRLCCSEHVGPVGAPTARILQCRT